LHGAKPDTKTGLYDFVVFKEYLEREDVNLVDNWYDYQLAYKGYYDEDEDVFFVEDFFFQLLKEKDKWWTDRGFYNYIEEKDLLRTAHESIFSPLKIKFSGEKENIDTYTYFLEFLSEHFENRRLPTSEELILDANKNLVITRLPLNY